MYYDVLRYKEFNWIGKYVSDNVQFNTTAGAKTSMTTLKAQSFLEVEINPLNLDPVQGLLGLGLGAVKTGSSVLSQLGGQWSYYTGPYANNKTMLTIGDWNTNLLIPNTTFNFYNVVANYTNWSLPVTMFSTNNSLQLPLVNVTASAQAKLDIQYVLFNYMQDSIILPNKTFKNLTNMMANLAKQLLCNNTAFNGVCYIPGVCSDFVNSFTPFQISFGDFTYTIPVRSFL